MNLSDPNTTPNENTPDLPPGAQKAMDGLLCEFAKSKTGDDEDFLRGLDAALDAAPAPEQPQAAAPTALSAPAAPGRKSRRLLRFGLLGSAAAAGIGAVLLLPHGKDRTNLLEMAQNSAKAPSVDGKPVETGSADASVVDGVLSQSLALRADSSSETWAQDLKNVDPQRQAGAPVVVVSGPVAAPTTAAPPPPVPAQPLSEVAFTPAEETRFLSKLNGPVPTKPTSPAPVALEGRTPLLTHGTTLSAISMPNPEGNASGGGGEGGIRGRGKGGVMGGGFGNGFSVQPSRLPLNGGAAGYRMAVTGGYYHENETSAPSADKYDAAVENPFLSPLKAPLSTFSIDVDTASYANLRRMLTQGESVPPAAVRIEEMVNYFSYSYPQAEGPHPFTTHVETASCPWAESHRLVKIGIKAKDIAREKRPSANLVFLCDVSGSMNSPDKLPLLVENLKVLTNELNADDTVGIVVYAGNEGVALEPTTGGDKQRILQALNSLSSGGSTNGGAGITRAYQMAQQRFIKGGINRVVLCTDGDFNVGTTSQQDLVSLVEEKAKGGVFLTVCGYGRGNLNDAMMEAITNKGNGVYHYVDSEKEGRKIFKDELFGTLMTVAKDVKLQVEFNPGKVGSYRLIGYDNRMLKKEDFANDKVDAGDIGAGHTVTALYEIIPPGLPAEEGPVPGLKYQKPQPVATEPTPATPAPAVEASPELLTVNLRYKQPEGTESQLLSVPHTDEGRKIDTASSDFRFAAAVAEFGEWLRGKRNAGRSLQRILEQAESARGNDPHGLRAEFIELVKKAGTTVRD